MKHLKEMVEASGRAEGAVRLLASLAATERMTNGEQPAELFESVEEMCLKALEQFRGIETALTFLGQIERGEMTVEQYQRYSEQAHRIQRGEERAPWDKEWTDETRAYDAARPPKEGGA